MNRTNAQIVKHLSDGIKSFKEDPSDTEYQAGYEACLKDVYMFALSLSDDKVTKPCKDTKAFD
jgi:hypothetical protein